MPGQTRRRVRSGPGACRGFNGGPSNCPAKLAASSGGVEEQHVASMEGRAIARPNCGPPDVNTPDVVASMEGRAIARPNAAMTLLEHGSRGLQWRAEQLPGQTRIFATESPSTPMPLQWRAEQLPGQTAATGFPQRRRWCFNGGPSNCPAKPARPDHAGGPELLASMEGRAIARPNWATWREQPCQRPLQWRAEQLPGQTGIQRCGHCRQDGASMEGRAIARPNRTINPWWCKCAQLLQWRAEQLPGQTRTR